VLFLKRHGVAVYRGRPLMQFGSAKMRIPRATVGGQHALRLAGLQRRAQSL
jgi:hypothetical protein